MPLTNNDLITAANTLGCEVACIRAIDEVESNGLGFKNGQLVVRFEPAYFLKYTGKSVAGTDRAAYEKAAAINAHFALMSSSWGRYQLMGFNYIPCGFGSVETFVATMQLSEQAQLAAFVAFIKHEKLDGYLRDKQWLPLALRYNGPRQQGYDKKLSAAYAKYAGQVVAPDAIVKKKPLLT